MNKTEEFIKKRMEERGNVPFDQQAQDQKDEKLGRTVFFLSRLWFAIKFMAVVSLVALGVLYFMGKPLWWAPIIALGAYMAYRLVWVVIWMFIQMISRL